MTDVSVQVDEEFRSAVDVESIVVAVVETLRRHRREEGAITVVITDNEEMTRLNREFCQVDAPTDVLSFATGDDTSDPKSLPDELAEEMISYLGDLIIAYPYAAAQAERFGNSVASELRLLAVHGTLHLLGYDHDNAENEARMWSVQNQVLDHFGDADLSERVYPD